ncbi:hypothetical protein DBR32_13640 [Taibaiella sp. KBW10]|uniref:hypothetical protein n=1 Tax=Taibaiella sp. KBW10 TaxID=2153357 RepID=UPI000F5A93E3|nr:hypothetical protein [Taibaiella sp. KBW10]RQO29953.1 hypothetical protein DBR32_13640 [Taibaiella sp. KBW10]
MKKGLLLATLAGSLFATTSLTSCKDKNTGGTTPTENNVLKKDITANMTLKSGTKYTLEGFVYVMDGVTLTIEPGAIIVGDKQTKGTLIIARGAKIMAQGTKEKPIVFTSEEAPGSRREGDWGGLVILGKAPINPSGGTARIEGGITPTVAGQDAKYNEYGGTVVNDNSGILKYVRIEFAGIAFSPDNEINGLTLGGVGNGTTISYVQVYRSGDDAFEWFGGTVNCDHLVATYSWDDDFDTDFGFSGQVQFGLAHRAKNIADVSGSNGFESDNDGNGSTQTPQTKAIFSNMTIVGPGKGTSLSGINANFQNGAQIRRNSSMSLVNSIILGFPVGVYIDDTKGTATSLNATAGTLMFKNNIIAGCTTPKKASTASFDINTWFDNNNNVTYPNGDTVMLTDAYKYSAAVSATVGVPSFLLKSGSMAATGASFSGLTGFQQVAYKGAFDGTNDWTTGWTNWAAETTQY